MIATQTASPLRDQDREALEVAGLAYATVAEPGFTNLVISNFPLPPGLSTDKADVLFRLPLGFPDATPDMFWVSPALQTSAGNQIPGTEMTENHVGRSWQRWSRHIAVQWRPGIDNLGTYLAYVRQCLRQAGGGR
jgi:Prokaryotic E2 family E